MKKIKSGDLILIVVLLLVAAGIFGYYQLRSLPDSPKQVIIEVDGQIIKTFDLPQRERIEYKVVIDEKNYNLVEIFQDRVRVKEATCPEQLDVKAGWINKPGQALICLPHKMIVKISGIETDGVDIKTY